MRQPRRLPAGGRIRRDRPLRFSFNGRAYEGFEGDTLASALLANGVSLVARSFKYHRPRGIVGSGSEEPNAFMQIGAGAATLPSQVATQVELYEGLQARSVNSWPSVTFDLLSVLGLAARFLPPGFYYKTFMWPRSMWKVYERLIRSTAGLGVAPAGPDPDRYESFNAHCDVLVAGGGPAGLAAALTAGRSGARVILADEQPEFGGHLLDSRASINGAPAMSWVNATLDELRGMDEVCLLPRSSVFGHYEHNWLGILERRGDHLSIASGGLQGPRERRWRVRAKQVVNTTGAFERPLVFPNNDRPGVMLASAVSTYLNRFAVSPGSRTLLFTNNDSAYQTALDLAEAGCELAAVVDVRATLDGDLPQRVRERGIDVLAGYGIVNVHGRTRVRSAEIMPLSGDARRVVGEAWSLDCDLIATSGGWSPALHLHAQSGGRPRWDDARACFVPGTSVQAERSAGACNGEFSLGAGLTQGFAAGASAAAAAGHVGTSQTEPPMAADVAEEPLLPMWLVPSRRPITRERKQFVDLPEDVSAADLEISVREGYTSIEHVKRYTTAGMGLDQGRLSGINTLGIVAQFRGQPIPAVGTTTFRPVYTPLSLGAVAERAVGDLADPIRKTPLYEWHAEAGALFENVGQWRRAWYYPRPGESLRAAVDRECLATRDAVGILDYSTLGKIVIRGPDAAELLSRVYTNDWRRLRIGRCRYGLMLGEDGMVMDDGVTARLGEQHYLMFTSTGGAATVLAWLERWLQTEWADLRVYLTSVSDQWADIALAGPDSRDVLAAVCADIDLSHAAFPYLTLREGKVAGVPARVLRISFSGELSYEINVPSDYARGVWEALMHAGRPFGITPYGTETMHVLRAEKGFIIVGQDTDGSVTPDDVGLGWMLSRRKDFLGKRSGQAFAGTARRRASRPQAVDRTIDARPERGTAGGRPDRG